MPKPRPLVPPELTQRYVSGPIVAQMMARLDFDWIEYLSALSPIAREWACEGLDPTAQAITHGMIDGQSLRTLSQTLHIPLAEVQRISRQAEQQVLIRWVDRQIHREVLPVMAAERTVHSEIPQSR